MMGWGWGHGVGAGMWVSWLLLVLLIGLVVFLVARAGSGNRPPQEPLQRPTGRVTPQEILAGRYARGEISTEEYEERLSHLRE